MDQSQFPTAAAASPTAEALEGAQVPSAALGENVAPEQEAAPEFSYDSDDNPHLKRARDLEARERQLAAENEQFKQLFARASQQAESQRRASIQQEFDDGRIDSAEFKRRMDAEIEQVDARYRAAMQPYIDRDWADQVAQHYGLSIEERQELNGVSGHAAEFAAQQIVARRNLVPTSEVASLRNELEQLRRSIAANQVANSGVSQTLGGNPTGAGQAPAPGTAADLRDFLKRRAPDLYTRRTG